MTRAVTIFLLGFVVTFGAQIKMWFSQSYFHLITQINHKLKIPNLQHRRHIPKSSSNVAYKVGMIDCGKTIFSPVSQAYLCNWLKKVSPWTPQALRSFCTIIYNPQLRKKCAWPWGSKDCPSVLSKFRAWPQSPVSSAEYSFNGLPLAAAFVSCCRCTCPLSLSKKTGTAYIQIFIH